MEPAERLEHAEPGSGRRVPVIVLAYPYSGVERLEQLLAGHAGLACTSGTGLLPLCAEAVGTWQRVDGRGGSPSLLAASSVRALVGKMTTIILARSGGSRWCEISFGQPAAAQAFLQLYPEARLLCWHRDGRDVIRAGVQANPWGLADRGLAPFVAAYPGSSAAAMAAYWADRTEALLRFEEARPGNCLRVRYEEVTSRPGAAMTEISAFLGLDAKHVAAADATATAARPATTAAVTELELPAALMPAALNGRVNDLQARLGYARLELVSPARAAAR